jgi:membrane protein DedA with SNARE-associated domain/rhodanese-related sulfurtransferase
MEQKFVFVFAEFGVLVIVASVFVDQIGLPLPAMPVLILAGAIAATSPLSAAELFLSAIGACLIANAAWYLAGRWYGSAVMKLLCRISINPDSCVSETQLHFERWGSSALVAAKFIPGLSLLASPLAGATGMNWFRFARFSALGAAIWVGTGLGIGIVLRPQIDDLLPLLQRVGSKAVVLLVALLLAYFFYKWFRRRQFFAALRMARISASQLFQLIQAGATPLIVDVRSATAHALDPRTVPGALRIALADAKEHLAQLPRDRDIVLYCTCPNEASAAQVARMLMTHGFKRVRPLHGGLDAWIAAGYEVELRPVSNPAEQSASTSTLGRPSR